MLKHQTTLRLTEGFQIEPSRKSKESRMLKISHVRITHHANNSLEFTTPPPSQSRPRKNETEMFSFYSEQIILLKKVQLSEIWAGLKTERSRTVEIRTQQGQSKRTRVTEYEWEAGCSNKQLDFFSTETFQNLSIAWVWALVLGFLPQTQQQKL